MRGGARLRCVRWLFLILALFFIRTVHISAQENPETSVKKLAVVDIYGTGLNQQLADFARELTTTVALAFGLSEHYEVSRIDFLTPHHNFSRAVRFFESETFDQAVFGSVTDHETGIYIELAAWEPGNEEPSVRASTQILHVDELRDATQEVLTDFVGAVSDRTVTFSELHLENDGFPGTFSVYIDGNYAGTDIGSSLLPSGTRLVEVFRPGRFGRERVRDALIDLRPNEVVTYRFDLPAFEQTSVQDTGSEDRHADGFGDLVVNVNPPDADIFLNNEWIGSGAIDLRRLNAGAYDVEIRHEAFESSEDRILVRPFSQTVLERQLVLDRSSVAFTSRAVPVARPVAVSSAATVLQLFMWYFVGTFLSPEQASDSYAFRPSTLVLVPRVGHALAGQPFMSAALSAATWGGLLLKNSAEPGWQQTVGGVMSASAITYDTFGSAWVAGRHNETLAQRIREEGVADIPAERDTQGIYMRGHYGSGLLIGAEYRSFRGLLGLAAFARFRNPPAVENDSDASATSAALRLSLYPFAHPRSSFRPYFVSEIVLDPKSENATQYPGAGVGLEWNVGRLGLTLESVVNLSQTVSPGNDWDFRLNPGAGISWRL